VVILTSSLPASGCDPQAAEIKSWNAKRDPSWSQSDPSLHLLIRSKQYSTVCDNYHLSNDKDQKRTQ